MFGLAIEIRLGLDLLASVALDPSIEVVVLTLRAYPSTVRKVKRTLLCILLCIEVAVLNRIN